jgi:hypothetical protein
MSLVVAVRRLPRPMLACFSPRWWHGRGEGLWSVRLDCGCEFALTWAPVLGREMKCPTCSEKGRKDG